MLLSLITGSGNYMDNPAAQRDTLWDTASNSFEAWKVEIYKWFVDLWDTAILFVDKMSFWVACMGSIYNIWLYAATRDSKYGQKITKLFLTYIFIQLLISGLQK